MRQARLKAPATEELAYYHCVSRVVEKRAVFGATEKEQFVKFMREYEGFCGVRVITYCILDNHFHLLVEVPRKPDNLPSDEELLARHEQLSSTRDSGKTRQLLTRLRQGGYHAAADAIRARILRRMWDLSIFLKLLKQRFTQWFNRCHRRKGTLWEERFKSVLIEGAGIALATVAAYIDLNPVRAGIVDDPKDYRWCGYAAALAGEPEALEGLQTVIAGGQRVARQEIGRLRAITAYRVWLFGEAETTGGTDDTGRPLRRGIPPEVVAEVIASRGRLPPCEYIRHRVCYFTEGAALGSRTFVEGVYRQFRDRFGVHRKDGAHPLRGVDSDEFFALSDRWEEPVGNANPTLAGTLRHTPARNVHPLQNDPLGIDPPPTDDPEHR